MKTVTKYSIYIFLLFSSFNAVSQSEEVTETSNKKIYTKYVCDIIFQFSETETTANESQLNGLRTTYLTNYGSYTHIDFSNNFGIVLGVSVRNIGMKTFDETINSKQYDKITRRAYLLGGSLALKIGSFSKHSFFYTGGEYELAFHYRQKLYNTSKKQVEKQGEWFSSATERFLPSVFIGYQFPKGYNFQIKYYLQDFLNHKYNGTFGDFTNYKLSQIFYLSLSFQFKESDNSLKEKIEEKKAGIDL